MVRGTLVVDESVVIGPGPLVRAIIGMPLQDWFQKIHENKDGEFDFLLSSREEAEASEREYQRRKKKGEQWSN